MTRTPANNPSAEDSWEQLEADLFGIEVGKEHTASERIASEPLLPDPVDVVTAVPKPIEEDDFGDFGDFGAGLVDPEPVPPPRKTPPPPPKPARNKPAAPVVTAPVMTAPPEPPPPPKPLPVEAAPAFNLADLDEGPTDEELDETDDTDDDEVVNAGPASDEQDPYWDALANWNWQEDDRSGKSRPEASRDRGRDGGRGDSGARGGRSGRSRGSDPRPSAPRETRPAASDERGHVSPRRSPPDRDRGRIDETPLNPVAETPEVERELRPAAEEHPRGPADVKSRRQDRRRSRRHNPAAETAADDVISEQAPVAEAGDDGWPAESASSRFANDAPRSRTSPVDDVEDDFGDESVESAEDSGECSADEERLPRRRRGRRRRRRPDRPVSSQSELSADEDIKHLEEDPFGAAEDDNLEQPSLEESVDDTDEDAETERPSRSRRPRRRRRGGRTDRPERPAPAPVARVEPEFDDELDDDEEEDFEEVAELESDDEFDEDQDREFVEDDTPSRPSRRHSRSRRSAATPFVRHIEDDDDDDSEPEPAVSYEDVPSWEEAISYLLNPSMVEGAGGDRAASGDRGDRGAPASDRGPRGERSSRPPRRGPRRDN